MAEFLHGHLDEALIANAYEDLRSRERERLWTLQQMLLFWTAVILRAPASLSAALREASSGTAPLYPHVEASKQAFFQRCRDLKWEFFAGVYESFVQRLVATEPPRFASHHREVASTYGRILAFDGSTLDPVARRLKVVWGNTAAPIPGAIVACYDLMHGFATDIAFSPSQRPGELNLAREVLQRVPKGSLILGDRLYGTPKVLGEVADSGNFGVFRNHGSARLDVEDCTKVITREGVEIEDLLVKLGAKAKLPARLIRIHAKDKAYEFITNERDRKRLGAQQLSDLYRDRWQVERMFQDLKTVLNLKRFYCGNTNAVAMQVYASAIVYAALRCAQGRTADIAKVPPEDLSPAKLYPLVAATSAVVTHYEMGFVMTERANPTIELTKPDWRSAGGFWVRLRDILADKTRGNRPRRRRTKPATAHFWRELPPPPSAPRAPPQS